MQIKKKAAEFFCSRPEVLFAFLFGSFAKSKETALSDIDLAVYIDASFLTQTRKTRPSLFDLRNEMTSQLMGALKFNEVDLIFLNDASPLLRHRILTQGERLMARDPIREQRFFVRSLHEYFDTEPIRTIQAKYLREYLRGLNQPNEK